MASVVSRDMSLLQVGPWELAGTLERTGAAERKSRPETRGRFLNAPVVVKITKTTTHIQTTLPYCCVATIPVNICVVLCDHRAHLYLRETSGRALVWAGIWGGKINLMLRTNTRIVDYCRMPKAYTHVRAHTPTIVVPSPFSR